MSRKLMTPFETVVAHAKDMAKSCPWGSSRVFLITSTPSHPWDPTGPKSGASWFLVKDLEHRQFTVYPAFRCKHMTIEFTDVCLIPLLGNHAERAYIKRKIARQTALN